MVVSVYRIKLRLVPDLQRNADIDQDFISLI